MPNQRDTDPAVERRRCDISLISPLQDQPMIQLRQRVVVFNKDGTLFDFDYTWVVWVEDTVTSFVASSSPAVRKPLYDALGYDWNTRRFSSGGAFRICPPRVLAFEVVLGALIKSGLSIVEATRLVETKWKLPHQANMYRQRCDLRDLFEKIRALGVKIVVCTSDRRAVTFRALSYYNVEPLVDFVCCGDDDGSISRLGRMWNIFSRLGVTGNDVIVASDAVEDLMTANSVGCSLLLGVTGGVSDREDLDKYSDAVISSPDKVVRILSSMLK